MSGFVKAPDAVLDYMFDWSAWLDGDTITAHDVTADTGLTVDSTSATTTSVTVWLSGGTLNGNYEVTCQITTAGGRVDDRTASIYVRAR